MKSRLRIKIEESGYTIKEIAEHCGKTQQTFNSYLNGDQSPTIKVLELASNKLDCCLIELLDPTIGYSHIYTTNGFWLGIHKIN